MGVGRGRESADFVGAEKANRRFHWEVRACALGLGGGGGLKGKRVGRERRSARGMTWGRYFLDLGWGWGARPIGVGRWGW